jgi:Icc-related predicted phosphoesterase
MCRAILVTDPSAPKPHGAIRLICFSDTHGRHDTIPREQLYAADILVHAGDFTNFGDPVQVDAFKSWVQSLQIPAVVIAGNADAAFDTQNLAVFSDWIQRQTRSTVPIDTIKPNFLRNPQNIAYLENSATVIHDIKFWGSPFTPHPRITGFRLSPEQAAAHWEAIPNDADVIVVHSPPFGIVDKANNGSHAGCPALRTAITRTRAALVVCGHIHEARGFEYIGDTLCLNASILNGDSEPRNGPFLVDLIRSPSTIAAPPPVALGDNKESGQCDDHGPQLEPIPNARPPPDVTGAGCPDGTPLSGPEFDCPVSEVRGESIPE